MLNCTAKRTIRRIAVCVLAIFVLGGCINQLGDDAATITIHLSSGVSRAAYPADDETLERLIFIVEFSGPSAITVGPTEPGTRTINVSVSPGNYIITATALLDGEVYAIGSVPAQAKAGFQTQVPLILYYAGSGVSNDTVINIAAIKGVTPPVTGETPVTAITENDQYSGSVTWSPTDSTFAAATAYRAIITLTAKPGFTLQGIKTNFFSVEGAISTSNHANSGVITAVFPTTAGTDTEPVTVDIAAIKGVTVPVTGGTPVTSITGNTQYTGTVTWSPAVSETFAPNTDYTATIILTAKYGYTLQGVAADFFTVDGVESANNPADSGIITAVFPQTYEDITINITDIKGIIVPVTGGEPVSSITETVQYTGSVVWSPNVTSAFASAFQYTATITLTVKDGYTLQGVTANLFKVAGTSSVSNSVNSGVITAVFPKTATTIGITAIAGVTAPKVGETPVTSITETTQYTGTVSWKNADGVEPAGAFTDFNVYIATITLTPKPGYTFQGVEANSFLVAGAISNNKANTGIITATFPQIPYALGGAGPSGGKVFYYSAAGFICYSSATDTVGTLCHYLEAAPRGSGELVWASPGYTSVNIIGTEITIGTGRRNTALILAIDADAPAAKACKDLTTGGNNDWFLPSKEELDLLYNNRFYVGNLGNANYYSSTQSSSGSASFLMFQLEDLWRSASKSDTHNVRAIRAF